MEYELYIVYMPRIAAALKDMGFPIVKVASNPKKPQFNAYWFKNTPELQAAIPMAKKIAKER